MKLPRRQFLHLATIAIGLPAVARVANAQGYPARAEIDEHGDLMNRRVLDWSVGSHPKRRLLSCLGEDMFILPSASLISRKAFEAVGGFDERLSGYEDDDLFLRLFRAGYRPGLERFHDREIQLVREKRDRPATMQAQPLSPLELVSGALQRLGRGRSG